MTSQRSAPFEVLVKMKRFGICGSDVHFYLQGRISSFIVEKPIILGHECSGEIAEVEEKVKNVKAGQRVVIEPGFTCGVCEYCRSGRFSSLEVETVIKGGLRRRPLL